LSSETCRQEMTVPSCPSCVTFFDHVHLALLQFELPVQNLSALIRLSPPAVRTHCKLSAASLQPPSASSPGLSAQNETSPPHDLSKTSPLQDFFTLQDFVRDHFSLLLRLNKLSPLQPSLPPTRTCPLRDCVNSAIGSFPVCCRFVLHFYLGFDSRAARNKSIWLWMGYSFVHSNSCYLHPSLSLRVPCTFHQSRSCVQSKWPTYWRCWLFRLPSFIAPLVPSCPPVTFFVYVHLALGFKLNCPCAEPLDSYSPFSSCSSESLQACKTFSLQPPSASS
jgi:hypothetical protein